MLLINQRRDNVPAEIRASSIEYPSITNITNAAYQKNYCTL